MSADIRSLIIEELEAVLQACAAAQYVNFYYNRGSLATAQRPAIVLLDGIEQIRVAGAGKGRRALHKMIGVMRPQIFGLLKNEEPKNEGQGAALSALRFAMLQAIAASENLLALIGANGDIAYLGCDTDFQADGSMDGKVQMHFEFTYVIDPN